MLKRSWKKSLILQGNAAGFEPDFGGLPKKASSFFLFFLLLLLLRIIHAVTSDVGIRRMGSERENDVSYLKGLMSWLEFGLRTLKFEYCYGLRGKVSL
jgi:hypothetical protein